MCECRATVVLQRAKQRVGIDLIARAIQITAAVVTAHIVAAGGNRAAIVEDVRPGRPSVKHGVSNRYRRLVIETAAEICRVGCESGVTNG